MGNNFQSTVIVFDVSAKTDIFAIPVGTIILEVEPIFQRKYAYLKAGSGSVSFQYEARSYYIGIQTSSNINTETLSYSNLSSDRIIAMPSKAVEETYYGLWFDWSTDVAVFYDNADEFFLKDISFSTSLSNVDKLNHGDNGYSPQNDDGWFITYLKYNLGGRCYLNNAAIPDSSVIWNNIYNTFKFIAGFTPAAPIITAMDGIELAGDWFKLANRQTVAAYVINDRDYTYNAFWQNRGDQISDYRDASGNPMLIKNVTVAVNSDLTPNDVAVWFNAVDGGANDSARATIIVAHGAANAGVAFSTNLRKEIAMSVVRASDGQTVKTETSSYNNRLGYSKNGLVTENNVVTGYVSGQLGNVVEIPDGVTAIGNNAFQNSAIREIVIPNTVTSIGNSAFAGCIQLSQISIPASITSIGTNAFHNNINVIWQGNIEFKAGALTKFIGSQSKYTVPSFITSISSSAFKNAICNEITIPDSVLSIGAYAFEGCSNLQTVYIKRTTALGSITTLGAGVFANCPVLSSIYVFGDMCGYKTSANWANYSQYIKPYDSTVNNHTCDSWTITLSKHSGTCRFCTVKVTGAHNLVPTLIKGKYYLYCHECGFVGGEYTGPIAQWSIPEEHI